MNTILNRAVSNAFAAADALDAAVIDLEVSTQALVAESRRLRSSAEATAATAVAIRDHVGKLRTEVQALSMQAMVRTIFNEADPRAAA